MRTSKRRGWRAQLKRERWGAGRPDSTPSSAISRIGCRHQRDETRRDKTRGEERCTGNVPVLHFPPERTPLCKQRRAAIARAPQVNRRRGVRRAAATHCEAQNEAQVSCAAAELLVCSRSEVEAAAAFSARREEWRDVCECQSARSRRAAHLSNQYSKAYAPVHSEQCTRNS